MSGILAREAITMLLAMRNSDATLCPSEAARLIVKNEGLQTRGGWRDAMPRVHEAVDLLLEQGLVTLSWKGEPLARRAGPYRIRSAGALSTLRAGPAPSTAQPRQDYPDDVDEQEAPSSDKARSSCSAP